MTVYDQIRQQFDAAMTDRSCSAIVFDIDSPGGGAVGLFDLGDYIFTARSKTDDCGRPSAVSGIYMLHLDTSVSPTRNKD
jgi:ClpP class serine protease